MSARPGGTVKVVVLDIALLGSVVVELLKGKERMRAEPSTGRTDEARAKDTLNISGSEIASRIIRRKAPSALYYN